jgi:transposase
MAQLALRVQERLSSVEVKKHYLDCPDGVEKSHWQIIWLMTREEDKHDVKRTAQVIGCSKDWIRKIVNRYNESGPNGLQDKRKNNGPKPVLNEQQIKQLSNYLNKRPAGKGLWSGPKVAAWITKKIGQKVSNVTGWKYLLRLGFSLQVPRPKNIKSASREEKIAFKKNSLNT